VLVARYVTLIAIDVFYPSITMEPICKHTSSTTTVHHPSDTYTCTWR
jgi:hypothetical protein